MAINLPKEKNKEALKALLVEHFEQEYKIKLDIVYINFIYKIDEMIDKTKELRLWHERK